MLINLSWTSDFFDMSNKTLEVIGLVPAAVAFDQSCQFGKELPIPQDIPKARRIVKLGLAFVWLFVHSWLCRHREFTVGRNQ